jgi:hypothetical protein
MDLMDDVDALYFLPLTEFTAARDALAKALKKSGQADEAQRVKALSKPSISAWAVNQLYWKHREAFDRLMTTGQQFRESQASQLTGKLVEKTFGDERRLALSNLSRLAANLLQEAGHNATPDIVRRITSTLEAMSASASPPGAAHYGRLAADLDPPGFEALAALIPDADVRQPPRKQAAASAAGAVCGREKTQQSRIADAKASLRDAERTLKEARAEAGAMDSSLKKANQEVKKAEKQKRHLEAEFRKASEALDEAERRARAAAERAEEAARAVEHATRGVEKVSETLQSLLR